MAFQVAMSRSPADGETVPNGVDHGVDGQIGQLPPDRLELVDRGAVASAGDHEHARPRRGAQQFRRRDRFERILALSQIITSGADSEDAGCDPRGDADQLHIRLSADCVRQDVPQFRFHA
jgi:hypothetical protein